MPLKSGCVKIYFGGTSGVGMAIGERSTFTAKPVSAEELDELLDNKLTAREYFERCFTSCKEYGGQSDEKTNIGAGGRREGGVEGRVVSFCTSCLDIGKQAPPRVDPLTFCLIAAHHHIIPV